MTREEAIKWLQQIQNAYIHGGDESFDESRKEALHMAIEALNDIAKWRSWSHTYDNACMSGEPSEDLISRAEAYTRIAELSRDLLNDDCINLGNAGEYLRIIRELPSADRPKGEWEIVTQGRHSIRRCSNCKWTQTYSDPKYMGYEYNFCPRCGADMRGGEDK